MSSIPSTVADLSYPNPDGIPGEVLVYACPFCNGSRQHFTLLQTGESEALALPPCGPGGKHRRFLRVLPPHPERRLSEPPLDAWSAGFEAERIRARGGRPSSHVA